MCSHFQNYSCNSLVDNEAITLGLWDTAGSRYKLLPLMCLGSGDFDELRPLSYPGTDAFLVCYSVIDNESLQAVANKWVPEIKQHGDSDSPIILVGTKLDLRDGSSGTLYFSLNTYHLVSESQGKEMAKQINAYKYIECSARTQENLQEVFQETIRAVINPQNNAKPVATSSSTTEPKGRKTKEGKKKGGGVLSGLRGKKK
jgi:Ras-related C3 botulinum toxin substrate 1